jgi:hydroxymethylbilane synthase
MLRVGTRASALAQKQTGIAIAALHAAAAAEGTEFEAEIVPITTKGDNTPDKPFEAIGPKGVFAAELERALLDGAIDVAVHSLKDLPSEEPDGLAFAAVCEREDARDVLVSRDGKQMADLQAGSVVGTSSARRRAQLAIHRPELRHAPLRGNVDTRLRKVKEGQVDAAILAGAGLVRLGLDAEIAEWLDAVRFVPAPGQGALVVEARADRLDGDLWWTRAADDPVSRAATDAERTFMRLVEGGCEVPLGAWARFENDELVCDGFLSTPDGRRYITDTARGRDAASVGAELAEKMLGAGARELTARA